MIAWTVVARSDCLDIQILYGVNDRNQCGTNPPALVATSACIGACDTRGHIMQALILGAISLAITLYAFTYLLP